MTLNGGAYPYLDCDTSTDTYTASISWGDGTTSPATLYAGGSPGFFSFTERHVYAAPGNYWISYTQTNTRTGVSRSYRLLADIGIDFYRERAPLRVRVGEKFAGPVASFTPSRFSFFSKKTPVTIAWGDGTTSRGSVDQGRYNIHTIRGNHVWKKRLRGKRRVVATVDVPNGGTITVVRPLIVVASK